VREDRDRWRAQAERLSSTRPCLPGHRAVTTRSPRFRVRIEALQGELAETGEENAELRAVADERREDFVSATAPTS
jgi:hypothetical protein